METKSKDSTSRGSSLEQSIGTFQQASTNTVNGLGRLAHSCVEANTEIIVGGIQVISDLITNLTGTLIPSSTAGGKSGDPATASTDLTGDVGRHLSNALSDSAKIVQKSAESFGKAFEPTKGTQK